MTNVRLWEQIHARLALCTMQADQQRNITHAHACVQDTQNGVEDRPLVSNLLFFAYTNVWQIRSLMAKKHKMATNVKNLLEAWIQFLGFLTWLCHIPPSIWPQSQSQTPKLEALVLASATNSRTLKLNSVKCWIKQFLITMKSPPYESFNVWFVIQIYWYWYIWKLAWPLLFKW